MAEVQDVQLWKQLKLTYKTRRNAPCQMVRGAAVVHDSVGMGYFRPDGSSDVLAYNSKKDDWRKLPQCPQRNFGLAVVNNFLTAVGGLSMDGEHTNRLVSFNGSKWVKIFPPMPTRQYWPAVISAQNHLIAVGGWGVGGFLSTVEVMNIGTREWYTAASLPEPVQLMSATICGQRLYLMGGWNKNDNSTRAVFTCTLDSLFHSCHRPSQTPSHTNEAGVWQRIADVPMCYSTCTTLNGRLLAVGGEDSSGIHTADVYMYDDESDTWPCVGHMSKARSRCLVVGLKNCIIAVGGYVSMLTMTSAVEVGYLQLSGGCKVIKVASQFTPNHSTLAPPIWFWGINSLFRGVKDWVHKKMMQDFHIDMSHKHSSWKLLTFVHYTR